MTNKCFIKKAKGLVIGVSLLHLLTFSPLTAAAQVSKNVTVDAVGQLSQQISNDEKFKISELKVSGPLNAADIKLLQQIVNRTKANSYSRLSTAPRPMRRKASVS